MNKNLFDSQITGLLKGVKYKDIMLYPQVEETHENFFNEYNNSKQHLREVLFGYNTRLSKEVSFKLPIEQGDQNQYLPLKSKAESVTEILEMLLSDYDKYKAIKSIMGSEYRSKDFVKALIDGQGLSEDFFLYDDKKEKKVKFPKGMSIRKAINKMKSFVEDEDGDFDLIINKIEEMDILRSRILQAENAQGKLVLSIDPIDFLTASENAKNWDSCYRLTDGDYAQSVFALLQSPTAFVVYMTDSVVEFENGFKTDDKNWRVFGFVSDGLIFLGQEYPYSSNLKRSEAIKFIHENMKVQSRIVDIDNKYSFESYSDYMFDDIRDGDFQPFGTAVKYLETVDDYSIILEATGNMKCYSCGKDVTTDKEYGFGFCEHCSGTIYCDSCDSYVVCSSEEEQKRGMCDECHSHYEE